MSSRRLWPLSELIQPRGEKILPAEMPNAVFIGMDHVEAHTTKILGGVPASSVESAAAQFYKGDVLYGRLRPYLNKVAIPSFNGLASAEFIVFPDTELVRSDFLKHRLNASDFVSFASHLNEGDRPRVGFDQIRTFRIQLPPPEEQNRIVAKIDEVFSELDKGVEYLQSARTQLDLYRMAVFGCAVRDTLGHEFPTRALRDLIGPINQGWSPKCDLNRTAGDDEWAIIKTTAVQPMRHILEECKPLPEDLEPRPSIEIHDGDLLVTRKGPRPRTGVVCRVKRARPRSMLCDTVYRFRCNEEIVLPEYLELALNSPRVVQDIDSRKSGINESGISLNHGRIKSIPVPMPEDKTVQSVIVTRTREKLSIIEHTESLIESEIRRSEALRQSVLSQAFFGRLVPQDPNDGPASVLLERIRADRDHGGGSRTNNKNSGKTEVA
jgi:type I restriction enzyme S subunit